LKKLDKTKWNPDELQQEEKIRGLINQQFENLLLVCGKISEKYTRIQVCASYHCNLSSSYHQAIIELSFIS
jgi:hypothetical protein